MKKINSASLAAFNAMVPDDDPQPNDAPEVLSDPSMRGQLAPGTRRAYALAGKATVTIRSTATQRRFTYRITMSKPDPNRPQYGHSFRPERPVWFVGLLNGADNTSDYQYLGTIFPDGFRLTRKSQIASTALSVKAFEFFAKHWEDSRIEVWHEGVCGRCGRALTVPESIASGIGPTCASKASF